MKKSMRIAHIGGGYWGKNIIRNLSELSVLRTICDSDNAALERYKEQYKGLQLTGKVADVLRDKAIDAVTIATPAATHFALVKEALIAGKDVFVEKPLALTPAEGEELAELSERLDRILMVGHIMRYHPAIQKMKELVDAGNIGKVRHFYSNRLNLGKVRTEENILWSFAPHDISIMNYLMGGPPTDVRASGQIILQPDIHDVTLTVMKWQDSVMGHIYVSWLHPFKEHRFVVVGDKAMLVFDDTKDSDKLVLYDRGIDFIKGAPVKRDKDAEVIEYSNNEPLKAELEHFLECCRSRQKPLTDGREGVEVLRVLAAAQKAIGSRTQRPGSGKAKREFTVHPTAVVDRGAQIGKGTRIWHFSHICSTAKLGERCSLGQNVYVANNVVIGNNVKIQNNVSVYEGVVLEDDCFCGPSMVFTNVRNPRSAFPRNTADDYQITYVRKGTTLGANCTIVCGISIGEHAFIAAGAVVNKDVKPHAMMVGVPARQIGWACECGMKLTGTGSRLHCADCGRHYRYENDRIHQAAKPA